MHINRISVILWVFIILIAQLASGASVTSTDTTSTTTTSTVTYPSLIECVCNTTLASAAVVKTSTSSSQTQKYVLSSCLEDVFAETGIRWYLNGPLLPGVTYWRLEPAVYSTGRAAKRLIRLGYRCSQIQLYDSTDPYY
ncbi:2-amino 3-ketobutyrate coenzyme A ligase [Phytophthora megakarya]|uniref:2-amino 3-ketobutyrate coenzyme A ligase n=1 Tax=Phytophthora megakarya TaxID=4795 RepID=A0A225X3P7_9STRA|nr:2-amino 3-ketobutyrate coenzyme A ligase [Phytophthora megakarya]